MMLLSFVGAGGSVRLSSEEREREEREREKKNAFFVSFCLLLLSVHTGDSV